MNWLSWWRHGRLVRARLQVVAGEVAQEAERRAARQRLLDLARRNTGPVWNAPTRAIPTNGRPLLTPGQAHRSRHGSHDQAPGRVRDQPGGQA